MNYVIVNIFREKSIFWEISLWYGFTKIFKYFREKKKIQTHVFPIIKHDTISPSFNRPFHSHSSIISTIYWTWRREFRATGELYYRWCRAMIRSSSRCGAFGTIHRRGDGRSRVSNIRRSFRKSLPRCLCKLGRHVPGGREIRALTHR